MLFIYDKQAQIFELNLFAHQLMCADNDIQAAIGQTLQYVFFLFGRSKTVEVIDLHRQIGHPFAKGVRVLKSQDSRRNQYSDLLAIIHGFKGGTDGDFGLSESNIPTDKTVHRPLAFHVFFDIQGGFFLIRGVFKQKGGFQFVLQIGIRGVLMAFAQSSFGVDLNEVKGNFLNPGLGLLFQFFPGGRTKLEELRRGAVLAVVLADFMKRVDTDIKNVAIPIDELDRLLFLPFHLNLLKAAELSDPVVDVGDKIPHFQFIEFFQGDGLLFGIAILQVEFVVTFKKLVIGVQSNTGLMINKTGVERAD